MFNESSIKIKIVSYFRVEYKMIFIFTFFLPFNAKRRFFVHLDKLYFHACPSRHCTPIINFYAICAHCRAN